MWSVARCVVAKALFGRALRVALALWVDSLDGRSFFQSEAQEAMHTWLGAARSNVPPELSDLVSLGLLARTEISPRIYFTALPSPYWEAFRAIGRALDEAAPLLQAPQGDEATSAEIPGRDVHEGS